MGLKHTLCLTLLLACAGCGANRSASSDLLVFTQVPTQPTGGVAPADILDARYPAGSRVVSAPPNPSSPRVKVLSVGLFAAGSPVTSPDGQSVLFVGKATAQAAWQIYRNQTRGGDLKALTSVEGGAMDPAILPDGRFVYSAPVPKSQNGFTSDRAPRLHAQPLPGGETEQLSFGLGAGMDATILRDGRILFVSPGARTSTVTNFGLYCVNNDGTEISGFAAVHDGQAFLRRPRVFPDGRLVFLASELGGSGVEGRAEQVMMARPFQGRRPVSDTLPAVRSFEPDGRQGALVTMLNTLKSAAVWRWPSTPGGNPTAELIFDDPAWHEVEAVSTAVRSQPMGRLSTLDRNRSTGLLLCLNANETGYPLNHGSVQPTAKRVRVLMESRTGATETLGEIPLQADGSFLAELPANRSLGFETLDESGAVILRQAPSIWIRPGENRACVGCHEKHYRSPENSRPLAVKLPPVKLTESDRQWTQVRPSP